MRWYDKNVSEKSYGNYDKKQQNEQIKTKKKLKYSDGGIVQNIKNTKRRQTKLKCFQ
jgi:hypothetical protein